MLFAIDVGNTNITVGLFDGSRLVNTFRMTTGISRTSDEYGMMFGDWLSLRNMKLTDIDAVIIASVVPNVMHSLTSGIIKYLHINPIIVAPGIKTGINVMIPNPKALGADRLVDAVAAYELYGGPVIVVDFGTATTHDLVLADGSFHSGVTSPGIRLSASALWNGAAKLPEIEIMKPDTILAKDTVTSMQAGVFYGYIGQTEYIIAKMKEESGLKNIKVVATGGLGKLISENTDKIDIYDPNLTLQGLRLIYDKQ
ncbi:MAG: type III pantothenate kinase [Wujia sp.]